MLSGSEKTELVKIFHQTLPLRDCVSRGRTIDVCHSEASEDMRHVVQYVTQHQIPSTSSDEFSVMPMLVHAFCGRGTGETVSPLHIKIPLIRP